jgi:hypothetical protein
MGISERINDIPGDVNLEGSGGPLTDERRHLATDRKVSCGRRGRNDYMTHRRSVSWGGVTRRFNGRRR